MGATPARSGTGVSPLCRCANSMSKPIHHISPQSLLHHFLLICRICKLFKGLFLSFAGRHNSGSPSYRIPPETLSELVHSHVEAYLFGSVVKHVQLLDTS